MALEKIEYRNSYLAGSKIVQGCFPITTQSFIVCPIAVSLEERIRREHILSEDPDDAVIRELQFVLAIDGSAMTTISGDTLLFI